MTASLGTTRTLFFESTSIDISTSRPIITLEVGLSIVTFASTPFAEPEPMREEISTPLDCVATGLI